jgi:GAF domain-containing protein
MNINNAEDLDRLLTIARSIISEKDLERCLRLVVKSGCELTEAHMCNVGLIGKKYWDKMLFYPDQGDECSYSIDEGIMGWVAKRKKPCCTSDVRDDNNIKNIYKECREGTRSELAVPILYNDECIGVLNVESSNIEAFSKMHINMLETLADFAAIVIINTKRYETLETLRFIDRKIASSLDLKDTLNIIKDRASKLVGVKDIRIRLLEGDKLIPMVGVEPDQKEAATWMIGHCIVGRVAETKESMLINDVQNNEIFKKALDEVKDPIRRANLERIKSEVAVPLKIHDEIIGVLYADSPVSNAFTEDDRRLLCSLADFAAIAIINTNQYETLKTLQEIYRTITSSLDLKKTLNLIKDRTTYLIGTKEVRIRLLEGEKLIPVVGVESDQIEAATWKMGQCIVGKVAETKEPMLINDVQNNEFFKSALKFVEDPKRLADLRNIKSEVAVPLKIQNRVIGVLNAHSPFLNAFTREDCILLQALADQAAIAIENARLYKDLGKQIEILERLNRIGTHITNLELRPVLKEIAKGLHEIIEADIPLIYLFDPDQEFSDIVYGDIRKDWDNECHPRPDGAGMKAIEGNAITIVNADEKLDVNPYPKQKGVKTTAAFPLLERSCHIIKGGMVANEPEKKLGIMYMHFLGEKCDFSKDMVEQLEPMILKITSIVKDNISNFDFNFEDAIATEKNRQNITEKLENSKAIDNIYSVVDPDILLIYLYDERKRIFGNLCYSSIGKSWKDKSKPRRSGIGRKAIEDKGFAVAYANTIPDINPMPKLKGVKTTAAVPLIFSDRVLGVMYMHFLSDERHFNNTEIKAIETFATNAAIAVEKANSFSDLSMLYNIIKIMLQDINMEDVLRSIGENANKIVKNGVIHIWLYDKNDRSWEYLPTTKENTMERVLAAYKPRPNGFGAKVIEERAPIAVEDLREQSLASKDAIKLGIMSIAAFPLEVKEIIIGVIYFHFFKVKKYTDDELLKMSMFASQVAIAIHNAKQYEISKKNFEILNEKIVKMECDSVNKINENLKLKPDDLDLESVINDLKVNVPKDSPGIKNELINIFFKLFYNADEIWISKINPGFSGAGVVMVKPIYDLAAGKEVIVKFGGKEYIEKEEKNYNEYVKWIIGGMRSTIIMASNYSEKLGGIVYSLIGNPMRRGEFFSFESYYMSKQSKDIRSAIDNLFNETCRLWYGRRTLSI